MNTNFPLQLQKCASQVWGSMRKSGLVLLLAWCSLTTDAVTKTNSLDDPKRLLNGAWQCNSKISDGIYLEINTTDAFLSNELYVSVGSMVLMPAQGFTTLDYTVAQYFRWRKTNEGLLLSVIHSDIKNLSGSGHDEIFPIQRLFYEKGDTFLLPVERQDEMLILKKHKASLASNCKVIEP